MKNNSKRDWFTNSLIVLAGMVVILFGIKYYGKEIKIPRHENIQRWNTLLTSSSPVKGNVQSPIKIVEFFSYGCGYCQILHHSLTKVQENFPKEVSVYHKPIHMGKFGFDYMTAIAAHCSDQQNSFSATHTVLFEYEGIFPKWEELAQKAAIPKSDQFVTCIKDRRTDFLVQQDEIISDSLGIRGVPYMIINGKGYLGSLNYSQLEAIIQKELD